MPDTDDEATDLVAQVDFKGEDQPECMLDAEALVALDLNTTTPDIDVTDRLENSEGLLGCEQNGDQEPANIFAQSANPAPSRKVRCSCGIDGVRSYARVT